MLIDTSNWESVSATRKRIYFRFHKTAILQVQSIGAGQSCFLQRVVLVDLLSSNQIEVEQSNP